MIRDLILSEAARAQMTPGEFLAERNRPLWSRALSEAALKHKSPLIKPGGEHEVPHDPEGLAARGEGGHDGS